MKKILFIVTQSEFGGTQRYIFEIVSNLAQQKYDILVAAGEGDGGLFQKIQNTSIKTIKLKWLKRVPLPWQAFFSIFEIFNLLKKEKPNNLFLCSTTAGLVGSLSSYLYKILTRHKIEVIYRIGGWSFLDPRPFFINKILLYLEKLTAPFKDKIIVNSEIDKEIAIKYKICPPKKIVKIYNGIAPEKLEFLSKEEARKKIFQFSNLTIIGCIANFYKTKGLPYFIEAAKIISINQHKSVFLIIGEGKQRKKLESLIKKYKLENTVFLLGRIPEAFKYLKAFDILVLPSLKEGFPWIILEAMAAEIPIIATNVGAIPEIIKDGKNGILIEPKDSKVIAEKIIWLLNNQEKAQKIAFKAKENLKKFNLEKMIEQTEKLL